MTRLLNISKPTPPVRQEMTAGEVFEMFEAQPDLVGLAVVDDAMAPMGLVDRGRFSLKMASTYGRALYAARSIQFCMDSSAPMGEAEDDAASFADSLLTHTEENAASSFIVVSKGRYHGIGSVPTLMRSVVVQAREDARQLKALASTLSRAKSDAETANFLLSEALEAMSEGVAIFDARDRLLHWNAKFSQMAHADAEGLSYGLSFEEILQRSIDKGLYVDAAGREAEWVEERMQKRLLVEHRQEIEQAFTDGRHIRVIDTRLATGGMISVAVDVTAHYQAQASLREALDRAEAASNAKTEFLANISHEIRTPLNGVIGVASVLEATPLTPDQKEMVGIISTSATTLEALLSDVLDLSKIEVGRLRLRLQPFRPADLARRVAALFSGAAAEKGVGFELVIDPLCQEEVVGDPVRLAQILTNLCSNAVKFTDRGSVRMALKARAACGSLRLGVAVSDTGLGIALDIQNRLFNRFVQADGSVTRRFGGTGLGLAISQELAGMMGGEILLDSQPGKGSTFSLEIQLPLAVDAGVQAPLFAIPPAAEMRPEAAAPAARLRVLVAEDHAANRRVIGLILGEQMDLAFANDGAEAVELEKSQPFDLILMDMQMPNLDGLSATRAIRAREAQEGMAPRPILMLTANVLPEHVQACLEAGADRHVPKPLTARALMEAVAEVLQAGSIVADAPAKRAAV